MKKSPPLLALIVGAAINAHGNVIINGDFESDPDLTDWTSSFGTGGTGSSIETTTPLAGAKSLKMVRTTQNAIYQVLSPSITSATPKPTITFDFKFTGASSATGNRVMNFIASSSAGTANANGDINIRVTGAGVLEVLSGSSTWNPTTITGLAFDTAHTLTLTLNGFGDGATYDISVGAQSATGLSYFFGNTPITDLERVQFNSNNNYNTSTVLIDNVSVISPVAVAPQVTSISKAGNTVTVQFTGAEGQSYGLNKSSSLQFSPANIVDTAVIASGTGTLEDTNATESAAFYRVESQ